MTLSEYIKILQELEKQGYGDFPIIYSEDDEGNYYHPVEFEPTLMQAEDLLQHNIEIVGALGDENIEEKDCNCLCIN